MEKIILASNNKNKIREFKQILTNYEIVPMSEIGYTDEIEETGTTFYENSKIKVDAIAKYLKSKNLKYMICADDSGLCVGALNGAPGVYSARYASNHNVESNRALLLKNMEGVKDRSAKFLCVITCLKTNGKYIVCEGEAHGKILTKEQGDKSFAYDCLFFSNELKKCFGDCTSEEKNMVSHRGKAIKELQKKLNN